MGQQQLILLVLGTIIVGVAIVVGIRAFTENSAKSNADALTQDAVRIANDAQAWYKKPVPFGGPDATDKATGVTSAEFADLGRAAPYANLNGTFTLAGGVITGYNEDEQNQITVTIDQNIDSGLSDQSIEGEVVCLGGTTPAGADCTVTAP